MSVTVRAKKGINELNAGDATKVEDVTVGGHQGRRLEFPEGNCNFDLAITDKSSVSVSALVTGKITEACTLGQQAVHLIEPKLPRG